MNNKLVTNEKNIIKINRKFLLLEENQYMMIIKNGINGLVIKISVLLELYSAIISTVATTKYIITSILTLLFLIILIILLN